MTDRRTLLVRLSHIPLDIRTKAARDAARNEPRREAKEELLAAALHPHPDRDLHWVCGSAIDIIRGWREAA